ncbi:hypothetical protein AMJ80_03395 [bacterium SM23_31]|nr:MAG: hypothetical protein AMJ80_03395 [bacterium SM23_31]
MWLVTHPVQVIPMRPQCGKLEHAGKKSMPVWLERSRVTAIIIIIINRTLKDAVKVVLEQRLLSATLGMRLW